MQWINPVPVQNPEQALWIKDGCLSDCAAFLAGSDFEFEPCATWNFHLGMQAQSVPGSGQFNTPEIGSVSHTQSFLIAPSTPDSDTAQQQINESANRPQPVPIVPSSATSNAATSTQTPLREERRRPLFESR